MSHIVCFFASIRRLGTIKIYCNTNVEQGITLMLVGMSTVFAFLTILVVAMSAMSGLVRWSTPPPVEAGPTVEEVAAITAAIALHRRRRAR